MEHLTTETIEKFIRGEYPYARLREISAHLLVCPQLCQKVLAKVDPDFLAKTEMLENARTEAANRETHFSAADIEAYVTKEFDIEKRLEMNRHFTKCRECSQQLKKRDPDYLSSFIKDNLSRHNAPEIVACEEIPGSYFKILVPAALFSLLLIVFAAAILLPSKPNPNDQAKLEQLSAPIDLTKNGSETNGNNISDRNENSNKINQVSPDQTSSESTNKIGKSNVSTTLKAAGISATHKQSKESRSDDKKVIIVKNRSLNANCESNPALAITPKDEVITDMQPKLTWKAFPNVVNYKIYLSDTENILIEKSGLIEGETTSYKVTNKLEVNKKYIWKVVATLKDGNEVYAESAYFSVGEKAKKLRPDKERLKINNVRCVESKH